MDDREILHGLWQHCTQGGPAANSRQAARALYARGITLEDTLQLLFHAQPAEDDFLSWIAARTRPMPAEALLPHADVLTGAELRFWEENGYLVLRHAVPQAQCLAAQAAIWDFLDARPDDPASWYKAHPGKRGLMLQFSDHPALAANRHSVRIRRAYQQLYGKQAIYASVDKTSFNPPENDGYRFMGSPLHWDTSLQQPIPFKLQGMLYLSDCPAGHGAFHCVPGFHRRIGGWLASVPPGQAPREWAIDHLHPVPVEGQAGDFIIWHQALPHCASANRGAFPRMVQYLTYLPEDGEDQAFWI
ncbi:phytanoyl-CoA dioxygenase family protein [Janthinobacterium sp. Mn2066]|uniref:phytanoyl-CoA dioxygenase family protein n=1 Tax=Janthinobacterium sp. Mn2066 TaxID=3395264 RepID=UPI003BE5F9BD